MSPIPSSSSTFLKNDPRNCTDPDSHIPFVNDFVSQPLEIACVNDLIICVQAEQQCKQFQNNGFSLSRLIFVQMHEIIADYVRLFRSPVFNCLIFQYLCCRHGKLLYHAPTTQGKRCQTAKATNSTAASHTWISPPRNEAAILTPICLSSHFRTCTPSSLVFICHTNAGQLSRSDHALGRRWERQPQFPRGQ